jgi:hypothetical protein
VRARVSVCVWRALCGCPANASINCIRAPPSTATPTPTTRRRLSLPVATACITRSFPPVGRLRQSARVTATTVVRFACDFAFFGLLPVRHCRSLIFLLPIFILSVSCSLSLFYSIAVADRVRVSDEFANFRGFFYSRN